MTQGIIQEVMQSWINRFAESKEEEHYLRCLESELIERIKQAQHESLFAQDLDKLHRIIFFDKLIGDSKE